MELTRKQVIEILSNIDKAYRTFTQEEIEALEYAINSLKTDEAYQIMYEGGEIFTKADMVAMLTDIQISVAELDFSWMCDYADGDCIKRYAVVDIIQEKINALKGDQQQDEKIDTSKSDQGKVY